MTWKMRIVTDGLDFPEGPSALTDGGIAVVEMQGQRVTRVDPSGSRTTLGELGGGPNGSAVGSDGAVYVANNGGLSADRSGGYWHAPEPLDGRVQRVAGGVVTTVADGLPGPAPHRPNDLCFGPDGRLYVTDSANWEDMRNLSPGRIVAVAADGTLAELAEVPAMPNGIAFAPGGDRLFVAQTLTRKVLAYPYADGALGEPEIFCKLPSGMPDGMCFDAEGHLYVCGSVGNVIHVFAPDGSVRETVETGPETQPTNCCLADGQLYVTFALTGQLAAYDVGAQALPLYSGDLRGAR